ncbi:MAG TPA: O-antigen ligase family protein [Candidatus Omnitrophota bacterium]|nr:O-antigen ligase family protein [Candidatus Omnitrophota bacterium]HPT07774.1 O-antigen ligase family protein [Candidatus Omnitrophota bacterium]
MRRVLNCILYWSIVAIPFFTAIAPAPMNVFVGFLIAAWLLKMILFREKMFSITPLTISLLAFLAVLIISLINSVCISDSLKGGVFRFLQYICVVWIVSREVRDTKHCRIIIGAIGISCALISVDAIWQVITGKDFIRHYAPVINLGIVRATASFKDSNLLGIYLSAVTPLFIGLSLFFYKGKKLFIVSLVTVLAGAGIFLTYSRPTYLALCIVILLFALIRKSKPLITILLCALIIAPFATPRQVKEWARSVDYNPVRFMCNDDRIAIYRNSIQMIRQHPIIGVGANTFMKNYARYKENPEYRNVVTTDYAYAHNNFLHMTGETGFLGLGVFLVFLVLLFKEAAAIYKRQTNSYTAILSLSLTTCLASFLINGLTESSLYYARIAGIFWFLIGFLLALGRHGFTDEKNTCC